VTVPGTVLKHVQFRDGCANQYKGCGAFYDLLQKKMPCENCFFGSRHGKGPCDTIGAVVKNVASTRVKLCKVIIANAHDMYVFASTELTLDPDHSCPDSHKKRTFVYIPTEDIQKRRNSS
jgi:hypothetical protein